MSGRRAVGLDIGTTSVRAAQVSYGKDHTKLERFGQVALPFGAVRGGEVVDPDAVAAALKQLWSQVKFSTKRVIVGIANQRVVVRQIDLPWMPLPELRKSLPFHVADVIPIPVDEAVLDLHPLEEIVGEDGSRRQRVLLVAASRDMIRSTLDALSLAGLKPQAVDLTSFAVLRALGTPDALGMSQNAEALVEVGASVTNIVVHQGGVPRFVRILLLGGSDLTEIIADRMGVSIEEAEAIKHSTALPPDPASVGIDPVTRVLEAAATTWVEEVRGSLDYYLAQSDSVRIGRVVLSGGGALLAGLANRLSLATRIPVELASPMARLEIGRTKLTPAQLAYADPLASVPVGLALGLGA
ncbi:MAG: type pilus assembly protein PilM [Mycobacterium sp.]|nr:type pilus assembly protein PilM [Mycobacterium sp.]